MIKLLFTPLAVYFPNGFDWGYTDSDIIMSKKVL